MTTTRCAVIVLVLGIVGGLTGCGGGEASSSSGVGESFRSKALQVCADALAEKRAEEPFPVPEFNPTKPDPAKLGEVADYLEKTRQTYADWHQAMMELGEPPTAVDPWDSLLQAIGTHEHLTADQIAAARRGDVDQFAADYDTGAETQEQLLAAATGAGVSDCAAVDR